MDNICIPRIGKEQVEDTVSYTSRFVPFIDTKLYNDLEEYRLRHIPTYEEETEDIVFDSSEKILSDNDNTTNVKALKILDSVLEGEYVLFLYVDSVSQFLVSRDEVSNMNHKAVEDSTYDLLFYLGDEEHVTIPSFVKNIKVKKYSPFILSPNIKVVSNESKHELNFKELFKGFQGESLTFVDLDTTHVYSMERMFHGCDKLIHLNLGDNFNTINVKNMGGMFYLCDSLIKLDLGDKFYTSKVKNMEYMFACCRSLIYLRLGKNFNTTNVENMECIFAYCHSLLRLDLCSKFKFIQKDCTTESAVILEDPVEILNKFFPDCKSLAIIKINGCDESLQKLVCSMQNILTRYQS